MKRFLLLVAGAIGIVLTSPKILGTEAIKITRLNPGQERRLEWQGPDGWYVVQSTSHLSNGSWNNLSLTQEKQMSFQSSEQQEFYRLAYFAPAQVTVFPGGSIDELRALRPSLVFDFLVIDGKLELSLWENTLLTVNHLWVNRSGSIRYFRSECEHGDAPNLNIHASGAVDILGEILLIGESGTRVSPGAACNSSSGRRGGNLEIVADRIRLMSRMDVSGGAGGTDVNSVTGSIGQQGADGGTILLEAPHVEFDEAQVRTFGGSGGFGSDGGAAADGDPGEIVIQSEEVIARQSRIDTDGRFELTANQTSIYTPITSEQAEWNWNGITADEEAPNVRVLWPVPDSKVTLGSPLKIKIEAEDNLSGVREIEVEGLGFEGRYPAEDRLSEFEVAYPAPPEKLTVNVWDNFGNLTSVTVEPVNLEGDLLVPAGIVYPLNDSLDLGSEATVNISGELVLKRGLQTALHCGSLVLEETGRIIIEDTIPANPEVPTELLLDSEGTATLAGTIDLSGYKGENQQYFKRLPETGGTLILKSSSMNLSGQILAYGGRAGGSFQVWESSLGGLVNVGQDGADGGLIRLIATEEITFVDGGLIAVDGGHESLGVNSPRPGNGGVVWMKSTTQTFADEFDINAPSATFLQLSGQENQIQTQEQEDVNGGQNNALDSAESLALFTELEKSIWIVTPITLEGTITSEDSGSLVLTLEGENPIDIEDLFQFSIPSSLPEELNLAIRLNSPDAVDLDLLLFESESLNIIGISGNPGADESLDNLTLEPGNYVIGVARFDEAAPEVATYTLDVTFPEGQ